MDAGNASSRRRSPIHGSGASWPRGEDTAACGSCPSVAERQWPAIERRPAEDARGVSDVTALHAALQSTGRVSVHGPVVTQLGVQPPGIVERFFAILEDSAVAPGPVAGTPIMGGVAEGLLLGGNLSLVTRLLGTPWLPDLTGAVLLLEDVGEKPYRIDRMWTHLRLAGIFDRVAGLALGDFTDCEDQDGEFTLREVLSSLVAETRLPAWGTFPSAMARSTCPSPSARRCALTVAPARSPSWSRPSRVDGQGCGNAHCGLTPAPRRGSVVSDRA